MFLLHSLDERSTSLANEKTGLLIGDYMFDWNIMEMVYPKQIPSPDCIKQTRSFEIKDFDAILKQLCIMFAKLNAGEIHYCSTSKQSKLFLSSEEFFKMIVQLLEEAVY
jgi:hypothetical protein